MSAMPRSDRPLLAVLIAAVVFVSAVAAVAVVRSGAGSWLHAEAGAVVAEPDASLRAAREPDAPSRGRNADPVEEPAAPTPASEGPPAIAGDRPQIQQASAGTACRSTRMESEYGSYPLAKCRMWQRSTGLLSGETLAKGGTTVTCQRDLDRPNPQYTTGHSNTWWIWTKSDAGTWDWFPESAVAEGASDQPINGIALCRDIG